RDGDLAAQEGDGVGKTLVKNTDLRDVTRKQIIIKVKKMTAYAKLAAGTVAGVTGEDVNTAAQTAQTAVENNADTPVVTAAKEV
ncbi:hypothetical protein CWI61_06035, partial [Neisseria meningitidis]|uniref:VENN motif pre-toxin domain-containing protein n=1 Tax=Neisseria meningitidis TaxID=487 RepID=UPI000CACA2B7